jgi:HSP20 family protein
MLRNLKPFNFPPSSDPSFGRDYDYSPFSVWKREYDWSPFAGFRRELDRLFNDFSRTPAFSGYGETNGGFPSYWPILDLKETDEELILTAELPGINEKDVELYFDKGSLTIRGYKKCDKDELGYSERFYGRFERVVPLRHSVDGQHCSANFADGLLTVRFQKLADLDNMKKIPIKAATLKTRLGRKDDVAKHPEPEFVDA